MPSVCLRCRSRLRALAARAKAMSINDRPARRHVRAVRGDAFLTLAWSEDPDIDDAVLDCIRRCGRTGVDAKLVEDVAEVAMDRSLAHK